MTQPSAREQSARDDLYDALDQSWYHWDPPNMAKGTGITHLIDAHQAEVRAAVLREAADAIDATFTGPDRDRYARYGADLLRRMAEEGR